MKELIAKLESATGPDRELDAEIAATIKACPASYADWVKNWAGEWKAINGLVHLMGAHGSGGNFRPLAYTSSLDAALTLVPEGYDHDRFDRFWKKSYGADVYNVLLLPDRPDPDHKLRGHGMHKCRAIALCIAALKAREASGK